jgi:hypothetical protein
VLEGREVPSTVNWVGGSGNWNDASHWLDAMTGTNHVPTATDDAVIIVSGITVTHGTGTDTVNSLSASNGTFLLSGGTLTATTTLSGYDTFNLAGGTLANTTVASATTITGSSSGGTLDGVTLGGNLDLAAVFNAHATVLNGLTLNGSTITLGNANGGSFGQLFFTGSQTLGGTGTVLLGVSESNSLVWSGSGSTTLTIGPNILVHGRNGTIDFGSQSFINQGTISADTYLGTITLNSTNWSNTGTIQSSNGGSLTLTGTWSNTGTITANAGTLNLGNSSNAWSNAGIITDNGATVNLGGTFTVATLGTFNHSFGTVNLTGSLDNSGGTLAFTATTGSWNLAGGTLLGGTVTEAGGELTFTHFGGTLNGVTFNNDLDLAADFGAHATVTNGLTLNNCTVRLGNAGLNWPGWLYFQGSQTLGGTGTVLLGNDTSNGLYVYDNMTTLTIGPNILVHGKNGTINLGSQSSVNQGTISADTAAGTITLNGTGWSNSGTFQARNGGTLKAQGTNTNFAAGTLTGGTWQVFANSTLRLLNANIATNAATILLDGANSNFFSSTGTTDALAGLATNAPGGTFTIQNGRNFTTAGAFSNLGTLTLGPGSTFTVNGDYTQDPAATLVVQLAESPATGQFGQLSVTGQATLDGTLTGTLVNGFDPTGYCFPILTFGSRSGDFVTLNLPPGGVWDPDAGTLCF